MICETVDLRENMQVECKGPGRCSHPPRLAQGLPIGAQRTQIACFSATMAVEASIRTLPYVI